MRPLPRSRVEMRSRRSERASNMGSSGYQGGAGGTAPARFGARSVPASIGDGGTTAFPVSDVACPSRWRSPTLSKENPSMIRLPTTDVPGRLALIRDCSPDPWPPAAIRPRPPPRAQAPPRPRRVLPPRLDGGVRSNATTSTSAAAPPRARRVAPWRPSRRPTSPPPARRRHPTPTVTVPGGTPPSQLGKKVRPDHRAPGATAQGRRHRAPWSTCWPPARRGKAIVQSSAGRASPSRFTLGPGTGHSRVGPGRGRHAGRRSP